MSRQQLRRAQVSRTFLCAAIAGALCGSATSDAAAQSAHRIVVPTGLYHGNETGAELLHDYGSFQLYSVDNTRMAELRAMARGLMQRQSDEVEFEADRFNVLTSASVDVPEAFRANKPTGKVIRLVQLIGPTVDAWLDEIRATGTKIVQYVPNNAYLVLADADELQGLKDLSERGRFMTFADTLEPWYKLNRGLSDRVRSGLRPGERVAVTVVLAKHAGDGQSRRAIATFARGPTIRPWSDLRDMDAITISVDESDLPALAQLPDVLAIETYVEPELSDEVQSQIIAGNLLPGGSGPAAPGYLPFLTGLNFSTTPADYPVLSIVDDGVGDGTAVNGAGDSTLTQNRDGVTTRIAHVRNCTSNPDARGVGGHGHINANIAGGYDQRTGFPFQDAAFYQRGQGMNPFARLANIKIFTNAGGFSIGNCGGTIEALIRANQDSGAAISSNSWGANTGGDYNADSRQYDIGTRDADSTEVGVQPLIFLFAAGNAGAGASTVGSPGTAKNVITVGASENQRPTDESGAWTDGCGVAGTGADNAMDVIGFSSRGPVEGGRVKPELIAPGTHINGTASTGAGYDGTGVCDQFRPLAQTVFAASSGTSHSTPALAGVSSLAYRYLQSEYGQATPSAALMKAFLIAHPTYLTGVSGNGNLPTNAQGYGMPNLGRAFDSLTDRMVFDQATTFAASGESAQVFATVVDPGAPARIVMAYSDAPGAITGSPIVNNLDLTVVNGGNTYLGNRFTGAFSSTGGSADLVNNYEAVFLAAGATGPLEISVTAANIAGDGVPGNADVTDQDFALVCVNCTFDTTFTMDATPEARAVCAPTPADYDVALTSFGGFAAPVTLSVSAGLPAGAAANFTPPAPVPPALSTLNVTSAGVAFGTYTMTVTGTSGAITRNDDVTLQVSTIAPAAPTLLAPADGATAVSIAPTLTWTAGVEVVDYVVEIDDDPSFGSINYTGTSAVASHAVAAALSTTNRYYWRVRARNSCGELASSVFTFTTGAPQCTVYPSADVPKTIGPNAGVVTNSNLTIAGSAAGIADLDVVGLVGTHTFAEDMDFELIAPTPPPTPRRLFGDRCTNTDNFNLNLDDAAATLVGTTCPLTGGGTFRPELPLSFYNGIDPNGTWTLRITDDANIDGGNLTGWGLRVCVATGASVVIASDDNAATTEDGPAVVVTAPGVLGNDAPVGLTAAVVTTTPNGTLVLDPNGGYTYTPNANFCGTDVFTYQASDGLNTDQARGSIAVACVNDLPEADNDAYVVNEDTGLSIGTGTGVLVNDSDPVEGSALTALVATEPDNGTLVLSTSGAFDYVPDTNFCGTDTFTYTANDGTDNSPAATVTIDVTCLNDAPVAVGDNYSNAIEDTPLSIPAPGVLDNDDDVDNAVVAPVFPSDPANGTVSLSTNGAFTYTPDANYCGADSFTYRITDGALFSSTVTVDLTVACVDDAPQAVADNATFTEDGASADILVLGNDTDIDAGPMSVASVTQPTGGTVTIAGGGTHVVFTPTANYCGPANFTYTLNGNSVGNVSVTVNCVNDGPTAVGSVPAQGSIEGGSVSLATASYFQDIDDASLSYGATGLPAGLAIDPVTGVIGGTIAIGAVAGSPYTVIVTASDGEPLSAQQTFQFSVTPASIDIFEDGFED